MFEDNYELIAVFFEFDQNTQNIQTWGPQSNAQALSKNKEFFNCKNCSKKRPNYKFWL